jgi:hypothetical protein
LGFFVVVKLFLAIHHYSYSRARRRGYINEGRNGWQNTIPIKFQLFGQQGDAACTQEVQFCFISGMGILDVPKYIRAYAPTKFSSISFVVDVHGKFPIVFPSSSQCVHTLAPWPLSKCWTLISYICMCVCVCVCEPKEALLLIYILSANFYFGECPKFRDFLCDGQIKMAH